MTTYAINIPKGFAQESVQIADFKMNVYKGGTGEPVVLIHGMGESALMWEPAMKSLLTKFTVIVPDLRGAGLSESMSVTGSWKKIRTKQFSISKIF